MHFMYIIIKVFGSTKVYTIEKEADGNCFKFEGVYAPDMSKVVEAPVPGSKHTVAFPFFAATSLVIHDPWSLPFVDNYNTKIDTTSRKNESDGFVVRNLFFHPLSKKQEDASSAVANTATTKKTTATTKKKVELESTEEQPQQEEEKTWIRKITTAPASWAQLPTSQQWIRDFIMMGKKREEEDAATTTKLKRIPSMANSKNWCDSVVHMLKSGRECHVLVYALVEHPAFCPIRLLVNGGEIHRHHSNNAMLFCVEDTDHGVCRMFMRCFSQKCKDMLCNALISGGGHEALHKRVETRRREKSWVELFEEDFNQKLPFHLSAPLPPLLIAEGEKMDDIEANIATQEKCMDDTEVNTAAKRTNIDTIKANTAIEEKDMDGIEADTTKEAEGEIIEQKQRKDSSSSVMIATKTKLLIENWKQIPPHECKWMQRALMLDTKHSSPPFLIPLALASEEEGHIDGDIIQPCNAVLRLLKLKYAKPLVYGILPHMLAYCPKYLAKKKNLKANCHLHPPLPHQAATTAVILIIEERNPSCHGHSYRLFMLCRVCHQAQSATAVSTPFSTKKKKNEDPWVELSKDITSSLITIRPPLSSVSSFLHPRKIK